MVEINVEEDNRTPSKNILVPAENYIYIHICHRASLRNRALRNNKYAVVTLRLITSFQFIFFFRDIVEEN